MGKYTEKDLERLNHAQLCDILKENEVEFSEDATKAQLRARILEIPGEEVEEAIEESEETPIDEPEVQESDTIADIIASRRESAIPEESGIDAQIAARRAQHGKGRGLSINDALAARRKKF